MCSFKRKISGFLIILFVFALPGSANAGLWDGLKALFSTSTQKKSASENSSNNLNKQSASTSPTSTSNSPICVQKISALSNLLQLNESKQRAALEVKDAIKPILSRFENNIAITAAELNVIDNAITNSGFVQKLEAFSQQARNFKQESNRLWQSITPPRCYPAITTDLHIFVALLFQQELDKLSPVFRTTVPGLAREYEDRYIVAENIPYKILKGQIEDNKIHTKQALQELALYLASAGAYDLALWGKALNEAIKTIFAKMDAQGLSAMKADVMLDFAPILLLTCDVEGAGKGIAAPSCASLNENRSLLIEALQKSSWRTGEITLWDRIHGKLVSFPVGRAGTQNCVTADPLVLVNSFSNEALNYGDCGMANLIYACPRNVGGQQMYPHLCHLCKSPGADPAAIMGRPGPAGGAGRGGSDASGVVSSGGGGGSGGGSSLRDRLGGSAALNGISTESIRDMFCSQAGGNLPDGSSSANRIPEAADCEIIHETQEVCGVTSAPNLTLPLEGAPTGDNCGKAGPFAGPMNPNGGVSRAMIEAMLKSKMGNVPPTKGVGQPISGQGVPSGELLKAQEAQKAAQTAAERESLAQYASEALTQIVQAAASTTSSFLIGIIGPVIEETLKRLDPNHTPPPTDSIRPSIPECTYFGQVMKEMNSCMEQQINAGAEAMGRPMRGLPSGGIRPPDDRKAHPTQDQEGTNPPSSVPDVCTLAGAPSTPSGGNAACGMMMCGQPNLSSSNCCGRSSSDVNLAANCPVCDGVPAIGPDGRCMTECPVEPRGTAPSPGPRPSPPGGPPTSNSKTSSPSSLGSPAGTGPKNLQTPPKTAGKTSQEIATPSRQASPTTGQAILNSLQKILGLKKK